MDPRLPIWARRSNPIVRRQLGIYWKTLPLEIAFWLKVLTGEGALMLLAVPLPFLYSLIMPVVTVSVILVPLLFLVYAQVLYGVLSESVESIMMERQGNTLALLMVTPLPFSHILFSKISAAIWRQLDNLSLVIAGHVFLSLPIIVLQFASQFRLQEDNLLMSGLIIVALISFFARLLIEPVMVGALGVLFGSMVSPRILAIIVGAAISGSYFLFLNLPRMMQIPLGVRVLIEFGLPLVLPVLITWLSLLLATYVLRKD
jgi:hypothetical protein